MDLLTSLRQNTAARVKDFMACGPKHVSSRLCLLALTALGLAGTVASGSWAAVLGGIGLNVGTSFLYERLEELKQKRNGRPTFDDALAVVQQIDDHNQAALQQMAEKIEVIPVFFEEALRQQRYDLVTDLRDLLDAWGSTLPFEQVLTSLEHIEAGQSRGQAAAHADHAALEQRMTDLRQGVRGDMADRIEPLAAEVRALRRELEELLRQRQAAERDADARKSRESRPIRGLIGAVWDELNKEIKSGQ